MSHLLVVWNVNVKSIWKHCRGGGYLKRRLNDLVYDNVRSWAVKFSLAGIKMSSNSLLNRGYQKVTFVFLGLKTWQIQIFEYFFMKYPFNIPECNTLKNSVLVLGQQLFILTLFEISIFYLLYFLKLCPIFVISYFFQFKKYQISPLTYSIKAK